MVANTTGLVKVSGYESESFYQLTASELVEMHEKGFINKNGYIYLGLKMENPFCDRPVHIDVEEFGEKWGVNSRAVYRCLKKIRNEGLGFIKNLISFSWINPKRPERKKEELSKSTKTEKPTLSDKTYPEPQEELTNLTKLSQAEKPILATENLTASNSSEPILTDLSQAEKPILATENLTASNSSEPILTDLSQAENQILPSQTEEIFDETDKLLTDLSQNCQNCQNQGLKPLSCKDFSNAHTIHTKNTNIYSFNIETQEKEKSSIKLEKINNQEEENQELKVNSQDQEQKIEENIKNLNEDTFCAASTSIKHQQDDIEHKADRHNEQEAVKPWLDVNGDFKQELVDYLAKQWVEKYPDNNPNIHVARSNAISHLNKPMKARQRWNEYQSLLEARKNSNYRDYTGYHEKQKEEIPVNPKAIALLAEYLKGLRKNPK